MKYKYLIGLTHKLRKNLDSAVQTLKIMADYALSSCNIILRLRLIYIHYYDINDDRFDI